MIELKDFQEVYASDWVEMAIELWGDHSKEELFEVLEKIIASDKQHIYMATKDAIAVGFIHVSLRTDYVEGSKSSPVGYVEGIYVKEALRKGGIARKLYSLGENWAKQKGCSQMGSDTWDWNKDSRAFHKHLGFKEEDILVHFIKDI